MTILTKKERKSLIERVALKWNDNGIKELGRLGNFKKYSPMFHFHISEPFDKKQNFIYITELFGNTELSSEDIMPMNFKGIRRQMQGNYNGLNQVVLNGITEPHFKPYKSNHPKFGKIPKTLSSPTQALYKIQSNDKDTFDNALLYLEHITKYAVPKTFHIDSEHDFLESSHNFF